jgi:hypothetical protein
VSLKKRLPEPEQGANTAEVRRMRFVRFAPIRSVGEGTLGTLFPLPDELKAVAVKYSHSCMMKRVHGDLVPAPRTLRDHGRHGRCTCPACWDRQGGCTEPRQASHSKCPLCAGGCRCVSCGFFFRPGKTRDPSCAVRLVQPTTVCRQSATLRLICCRRACLSLSRCRVNVHVRVCVRCTSPRGQALLPPGSKRPHWQAGWLW